MIARFFPFILVKEIVSNSKDDIRRYEKSSPLEFFAVFCLT